MRILPWPNLAQMAFAIRDDDIGFFTPPEKLQLLYESAIRKGFKISLSVIPMQKATNDLSVPPAFRGKNTFHSVKENKELIEYLLPMVKERVVDILQHGYSHGGSSFTPELLLNGRKMGRLLCDGKAILEEIFDEEIKVFVPPWEFLTAKTWRELANKKLNVSMATHKYLLGTPFTVDKLRALINLVAFNITEQHCFTVEVTKVSDVLNVSPAYRHYIGGYDSRQSADRTFWSFKTIFEKLYAGNGCLIAANHYWEYFIDWEDRITSKLQKKYFDQMLDFVDGKKHVWKCGLNEIVQWVKLRESVIAEEKDDGVIVCAPQRVAGLTVWLSSCEHIDSRLLDTDPIEVEGTDGSRYAVLNMKPDEKVHITHG